MEITYNIKELEEFKNHSKKITKLIFTHIIMLLFFSIPAIIGTIIIINKSSVISVLLIIISGIFLVPTIISFLYNIRIYFIFSNKNPNIFRSKVCVLEEQTDASNNSIYRITTDLNPNKMILLFDFNTNIPIKKEDEVDVILSKNGKSLFAIIPIDILYED